MPIFVGSGCISFHNLVAVRQANVGLADVFAGGERCHYGYKSSYLTPGGTMCLNGDTTVIIDASKIGRYGSYEVWEGQTHGGGHIRDGGRSRNAIKH